MRGIPLVEGVKKRGRGIEEVEKWKRERERNSRGREIEQVEKWKRERERRERERERLQVRG